MKLYTLLAASSAIFSTAIAAPIVAARNYLSLTNQDFSCTVGTPFSVTWAGNTGAVTLSLKSGPAENLETIGTIASGIWGNPATWTPSSSGTYAIEITDESGATNYSPQFFVAGSGLSRRSLAQRSNLQLTNGDYASSIGAPMIITWEGNDGPVTIYLKSGSADNLETVGTVASGVWGNAATWTPTTSGTYAFEIVDAAGNTNYSPQFWVGA